MTSLCSIGTWPSKGNPFLVVTCILQHLQTGAGICIPWAASFTQPLQHLRTTSSAPSHKHQHSIPNCSKEGIYINITKAGLYYVLKFISHIFREEAAVEARHKRVCRHKTAEEAKTPTHNKPPLKTGKRGSVFRMRETGKGYSDCTPIKWWFVTHIHTHALMHTHAHTHACTHAHIHRT